MNYVLDVQQVFLKINPYQVQSNLNFICEEMFNGKHLCKLEQLSFMSNHKGLRKAQIHYAALDAYICLEIYKEAINSDKDVVE